MGGQYYLPAPERAVDGDESVRFGDEPWANANGDQSCGRLLDSVGGSSGVERIVQGLLQRVLSDRVLAPAFAGVDMERLVAEQVRFLAHAFGGGDADAVAPVVRVRLTGEQFDRFALHLAESFASLGVPQLVTEQLMLAATARAIADSCA